MRMRAGNLGITAAGVQPQSNESITPIYRLTPGLPENYDVVTASGAIPGNETGQTISTLAANSADLCAQQGGMWDSTKSICNMCPQNAFAALFMPQTWDPTSGLCSSSYTPLIIAGGGAVVLLFLVAMLSKK